MIGFDNGGRVQIERKKGPKVAVNELYCHVVTRENHEQENFFRIKAPNDDDTSKKDIKNEDSSSRGRSKTFGKYGQSSKDFQQSLRRIKSFENP